jgi:hypothetical protein
VNETPEIDWPDFLDTHEAEILQLIVEDEAFRHEAAHVARRCGERVEIGCVP